jgi:DNA-binding NarL/FixJ family response regulator
MSKTLRVLLLEDSAADAALIAAELERSGLKVVAERVDSREDFARALRTFEPHVVLADHSLARFNARAALKVLQAVRPAAPLIVVTGALDEQAAVAVLRGGAEDLVLKDNLHRLRPAIEHALSVRRPLGTLSPRQLQVLRLVAQGHSTSEIAAQLAIGVKTVETHRGAIMKRLQIHDVVGLVRYAVRVGLVPPDA